MNEQSSNKRFNEWFEKETKDYFYHTGIQYSRAAWNAQEAYWSKRCEEMEKNYYELIMSVGTKWPNETRHQTALKYIRQAEEPSGETYNTVPKCGIDLDSKDDDCGHLNKVSPLPSKDTKKEGSL